MSESNEENKDNKEFKVTLIRGPQEKRIPTRLSPETIERIHKRLIHTPWRDDD